MVTCGGKTKTRLIVVSTRPLVARTAMYWSFFFFWIYYEAPQTNRKKPNAAADVKLEIVL